MLTLKSGFGQEFQRRSYHSESNFGKLIWSEDFKNNKNSWPEFTSNTKYSRLKEGKFLLATRLNEPLIIEKEIGIPAHQEFELKLEWKTLVNKPQGLTGLCFGDQFELYGLVVNKNGKIQLVNLGETEVSVLAEKEGSYLWSSQENHSMTFRQTQNMWEFFLDGSYVFSYKKQEAVGSQAGLFALGKTAVEVQKITLSGIQVPRFEEPLGEIIIHSPPLQESENVFVKDKYQQIMGQLKDMEGIHQVFVNGEEVYVNSKGYFFMTKRLDSTVNHIHLASLTKKGKWVRKSFNIILESTPKAVHTNKWVNNGGNNHLLLIGINEYSSWPELRNAVKDVRDIAHVLTRSYDFEQSRVTQILNGEATREKILETLENLQERLGPNDNLLIYYAGHGYYDEESQLGYWVPVDARLDKIPDYIRNSTIHDYLRTINTKHTFLIADACYAGSLFANYRGSNYNNSKSRWAFTSGNLEKVWDGKPGGNSPFAKSLIDFLVGYNRNELPINLIIESVSKTVSYRTNQTPKGSPLKMAGDSGGILVLKKTN
ncbi:MAG: caspase family protein [Bacteroidia bacterium]|nr:caspase family protein [Bacteroidia bacterium]